MDPLKVYLTHYRWWFSIAMLVYQRVHGAPPWTLRFFHGRHGVLALTVTGGHPRCARLHLLRRSGLEVGGIGETRMVFNWLFRLFVEDDILPNCMEMKLLQGFLLGPTVDGSEICRSPV